MAVQTHIVPAGLISWGVPSMSTRRQPDTWARDELTDHTAALCRLLHGTGQPHRCTRCSALLTPAPTGPVGSSTHPRRSTA